MGKKKGEEIKVDTHPVILWIPKNSIYAKMEVTIVDDDGKTFKANTKFNNDALVTARKDFNEQVGDDEYYAKYVLTEKGLAMLEGLQDE